MIAMILSLLQAMMGLSLMGQALVHLVLTIKQTAR